MKRLVGFVCLLAALASGCGGVATGTLTGKVSVNGKPLDAGTLILHTENKMTLNATIKDGSYAINNVPVGKVTLAVRPVSTAGPQTAVVSDTKEAKVAAPTTAMPQVSAAIPPRYQQVETAGLSTTVNKGANEFPIDLK